jgi:hypothetical protein
MQSSSRLGGVGLFRQPVQKAGPNSSGRRPPLCAPGRERYWKLLWIGPFRPAAGFGRGGQLNH